MTSTLRSTVATGLASTGSPDPSLALASADRSNPALDELAFAEALIEPESRCWHEMDQLTAGHSCLDVFGSHETEPRTLAEVLVFPPPLEQADQP